MNSFVSLEAALETLNKTSFTAHTRANLSNRVHDTYEHRIYEFLDSFSRLIGISPLKAKLSHLRKYLDKQLEMGVSVAHLREQRAAIQYWHKEYRGSRLLLKVPEGAKSTKNIRVLKHKELDALFHFMGMHVCATLLRLIYASGLRLEEALQLQKRDMDFKRFKIRVRAIRERPQRYTIFSATLESDLMQLAKRCQPKDFLFSWKRPGSRQKTPLSPKTPQVFLASACQAARLKAITVRTLRENFAIHLLARGIDRQYVTELMGFRSRQPIVRYQRCAQALEIKVSSPLDSHKM